MAPRSSTRRPTTDQTYTSTPALAQKRFPHRRRTVKTHEPARRLLEKRQSTLTQIDFARLSGREYIEDSEEDEFNEEEPPRKRRKTLGQLNGDEGNKVKRKNALTQTLTQMDFVRSRRVEDSEEEGLLSDDEELEPHPGTNDLDLQNDIMTQLEFVVNTEPKDRLRDHDAKSRENPRNKQSRVMPPPKNPSTPKRIRVLAVPSSQTPPTTPLSTQQSPKHPRSGKDRSPLQERSTNVPMSKELVEDNLEQMKQNPWTLEPTSPSKDADPMESPTKLRAREFRARIDELRNGGFLQQTKRKTGPFERNQVIRSSTHVSSESDEAENEVTKTRPQTGETQFAIGEETQAILGDIDFMCESERVKQKESDQDQNTSDHGDENENDDQDQDLVFDIGEPQEPLEEQSLNILDPQHIHPHEASPELPLNSEEEERVPSSQNETPRGTRRIPHQLTTEGRRVTFSDQVMLPIPRSPTLKASQEEYLDTQDSIDPVSVQLLYESQAYAALAASSPIGEPPVSTSSPVPASSRQSRTPTSQRNATRTPTREETQAPSNGRTESLSTTSGTYPESARDAEQSPAHVPSSPQRQPEIRSSPTTPGIFRFLRGPITVSQLIPDSLRSGLEDSIGLPPRWLQENSAEDEDEDDDEL
jgi:hypothetical protein